MANKEYQFVEAGGACFHAPTAAAMSRDEFINKWIDRIDWIYDEIKRKKFLSQMYDDCVAMVNPPKFCGNIAEPVDKSENITVNPDEKPVTKVRSKKSIEKKE